MTQTEKTEKTIEERALQEFRRYLLREEREEATVQKYLFEAEQFAKWLGERELCREAVNAWKKELIKKKKYAAVTVNGKLSALNTFLRFLNREDCKARTLRVQRQVFRKKSRELTKGEYQRLVKTAARLKKKRLLLLMETLCACGIRVSEVRFITLAAAIAGGTTVCLKGKNRYIFIPHRLAKKLIRYAKSMGIISGEIFITRTGKSISRRQIWAEMKALCKEAGVEESKVFPHNLRHLFATEFYKETHDIVKLSDLLGHSSIETTRIYLVSTGAEHQRYMNRMQLVS